MLYSRATLLDYNDNLFLLSRTFIIEKKGKFLHTLGFTNNATACKNSDFLCVGNFLAVGFAFLALYFTNTSINCLENQNVSYPISIGFNNFETTKLIKIIVY